jgi:hypothetical protein
MHQLIDSLPPLFSRVGGQPWVEAPDRSNRKRNKSLKCILFASIFTSPLLIPFSYSFRFSTISSTFSPKICLRYVKHSCGQTWTESIEPLGCPCWRCLGEPSPPKLLSYHLLHRVEFFGDHQTPNVTAPATRWQNQDCIA